MTLLTPFDLLETLKIPEEAKIVEVFSSEKVVCSDKASVDVVCVVLALSTDCSVI